MQELRRGLTRKLRAGVALAGVLCLLGATFLLAKDFVKPPAKPAATYPLHDNHTDEAVAAGVDPYDDPEKAEIFNVKWAEQGFLPIFLVITNDGDQPVSLANMHAQLITSQREKIPAASNDELYRRLSHVNASGPKYPLPFPRTKVKGAVGKKALDEMDAAQFSAKAVEPHSTQAGFVFFDVTGLSSPLAGGRFYLTGLRNAKGTELLYFEIYFQR
jgi:hypothetical protein